METVNLQVPSNIYRKIEELAASKNMTINELLEEVSNIAASEYEAERKFKIKIEKASKKRGLEILDKIDRHFQEEK